MNREARIVLWLIFFWPVAVAMILKGPPKKTERE